MTDLLVDGDLLAYRYAFAAESREALEDGTLYITFDSHQATWGVHQHLLDLVKRWKPDEMIVVLSDTKNFRKELCPTYKSNRKGQAKPPALRCVMDHLRTHWRAISWENLEADDVIGILATKPGADYVMVSRDKDMLTVPGRLSRDGSSIQEVTKDEADYQFYIQSLMGDSGDGYHGIKGLGIKTAVKVLAEDGDPWENVVKKYESKGLTEDDALLQARLARILRYEDYDMETGEIRYWTPTKENA